MNEPTDEWVLDQGREQGKANPVNEMRGGGPSIPQQDSVGSSIFPCKGLQQDFGIPFVTIQTIYSETHPRLAQVTYQREPPQPTVELLTGEGERALSCRREGRHHGFHK